MSQHPPPPPPQPTAGPPPGTAYACTTCGQQASVSLRAVPITRKRRVKFGVIWVTVTIFTGGLGFILWLVWPRTSEQIGSDRSYVCGACGARTPA